MNIIYSEAEITELSARIKRRGILTCVLASPFLAAFIYFFVMHLQITIKEPGPIPDDTLKILAIASCILFAFVLIFGFSFFVNPLKAYRKHIRNSLHGRSHDMTYTFKCTEPEESLIDHVNFRSVVFDGEPDRHGVTAHMFYWDALKEIPDFSEGETVTIRYYDRFIFGWSREVGHISAVNVE